MRCKSKAELRASSRLNQGQGGIYRVRWLKDGLNSGGESVGLGLKNGATAALDFVGPVGQTIEEGAHLVYERAA